LSADLPLSRWQPWPRDRAASVRRLSLRSKGVPRQRQRPFVARAATACFGCRRRAVEAAAADCARARPSGWWRTGSVTWHGRPGCGAKVSRRIFENARPAEGGRNTSIAQPRSVWFFLGWRAEIKWSRSGPSVKGLTRGREEDGGRHIVRVAQRAGSDSSPPFSKSGGKAAMKRRFLSLLTILVKDERVFAGDNEFEKTRKVVVTSVGTVMLAMGADAIGAQPKGLTLSVRAPAAKRGSCAPRPSPRVSHRRSCAGGVHAHI
jgi:hypothetical protein